MDFRFPPELDEWREEVRAYVKSNLAPLLRDTDDSMGEGEDPRPSNAVRKELARKGWLTLAWPKEYGGMGVPHLQQMVFNEEMSYNRIPAGDSGINMLGPTLMIHGTEEQKRTYLPAIANADMRWCQGYSEPGSGSDLASLQTRAVEDGDDFVVNGTKIWTSGAHHADHIFVLVRTNTDAPKHRGISFLLADMKTPGLTVRPLINMASQHGFNQLFFDNFRIPKQNLVGELNRGWYVGATLLDFERSGVGRSAGALRTLEELVQFAKETKRNGHALSQDPRVRHRLAEHAIEVQASRMISYHIGWMQSKGQVPNKEASMGKLFGSEMQQRIAQTGMSLLGLYGTLDKGSKWAPLQGRLARSYLSSFSSTIAAGTSEIQRNVIAQRGLGLPRD